MGSAESYLRITNMTDKSCISHVWNVSSFDFDTRDPMKFDGLRFHAGQSHKRRIERNPRANGNMFNLKLSFSHNKYLEFRIDQGRAARGTGEFSIYGDIASFDVNYYSGDKTLNIDVRNSQFPINQDMVADLARYYKERIAAQRRPKSLLEQRLRAEIEAEHAKRDAEETQKKVVATSAKLMEKAKELLDAGIEKEHDDKIESAIEKYLAAVEVGKQAAAVCANESVYNFIITIIDALVHCGEYEGAERVVNSSKVIFPEKSKAWEKAEEMIKDTTWSPEYTKMFGKMKEEEKENIIVVGDV